jgi:hypothetical protein
MAGRGFIKLVHRKMEGRRESSPRAGLDAGAARYASIPPSGLLGGEGASASFTTRVRRLSRSFCSICAKSRIQPKGENRFSFRNWEEKGAMRTDTSSDRSSAEQSRQRRANRRLNGMGTKAGVPDPPTRGRFTRTLAMLDAALRVWESHHNPRRASVWRR